MKSKIAERGALHESLRSGELAPGIEPFNHSKVTAAGEKIPEIRNAQLFVHLGVATAGGVDIEPSRILVDDLLLQGLAMTHEVHNSCEMLQTVSPYHPDKLDIALPGNGLNDAFCNLKGFLFSELLREGLDQRARNSASISRLVRTPILLRSASIIHSSLLPGLKVFS